MKFDIITQVRFKSTRLPGKILLNFSDTNFLSFFVLNLKRIKKIQKIILACPEDEYKDIFRFFCKKLDIESYFFKGDENNVLKRYFYCAKKFCSQNIIRITSDCPFINPIIVSQMIEHYKKKKLAFLTNNKPRFVPHGFDCEIFNFDLLNRAYVHSKNNYEREHVTPWIYNNIFNRKNNYLKIFNKNYSYLRFTLDTPKDYLYFIKNSNNLKSVATSKNIKLHLEKF